MSGGFRSGGNTESSAWGIALEAIPHVKFRIAAVCASATRGLPSLRPSKGARRGPHRAAGPIWSFPAHTELRHRPQQARYPTDNPAEGDQRRIRRPAPEQADHLEVLVPCTHPPELRKMRHQTRDASGRIRSGRGQPATVRVGLVQASATRWAAGVHVPGVMWAMSTPRVMTSFSTASPSRSRATGTGIGRPR